MRDSFAAASLALALPVIPLTRVGSTPVTAISPLVQDQVGWRRYVDQVAAAYDDAGEPRPTAVIASNYGEAGALARYGGALGLPHPVSGQNALFALGGPAEGTRAVVVVGGQLDDVRTLFDSCDVVARLDNGVGVDNEEQGLPVAVCRGPRMPWSAMWPRFRHLD